MRLTPDQLVLAQWGPLRLNATLLDSWILMALLGLASWLATRRLRPGPRVSGAQAAMEIVVVQLEAQIRQAGLEEPGLYLPFLGTLFIFIFGSALLGVVPGMEAPTASLSTTFALALVVFCAVPYFGLRRRGLGGYLGTFLEPNPFMLPFNIISEFSRTLALAVRLFGNMMSGGMILAILLAIAPFFFPVLLSLLGLITGAVQAYIFSILAAVYIAAAASRPKAGANQGA